MEVAYCEFFAPCREIISFDVASRQIYILVIPGLSAWLPTVSPCARFQLEYPRTQSQTWSKPPIEERNSLRAISSKARSDFKSRRSHCWRTIQRDVSRAPGRD